MLQSDISFHTETKCPIFYVLYFQMHIVELKLLYLEGNLTEFCFQ